MLLQLSPSIFVIAYLLACIMFGDIYFDRGPAWVLSSYPASAAGVGIKGGVGGECESWPS